MAGQAAAGAALWTSAAATWQPDTANELGTAEKGSVLQPGPHRIGLPGIDACVGGRSFARSQTVTIRAPDSGRSLEQAYSRSQTLRRSMRVSRRSQLPVHTEDAATSQSVSSDESESNASSGDWDSEEEVRAFESANARLNCRDSSKAWLPTKCCSTHDVICGGDSCGACYNVRSVLSRIRRKRKWVQSTRVRGMRWGFSRGAAGGGHYHLSPHDLGPLHVHTKDCGGGAGIPGVSYALP